MENKLKLSFDYGNMMNIRIGKNGFSRSDIENAEAVAKKAFDSFQKERGKGMTGWSELPYNQKEITEDILKTAKEIRSKYKYFVVLGIGGSALGPLAAFQALKHLHYNELKDSVRNGPKFYVEDNVDPERMNALLDVIDVNSTMFNVITKSGSTSETMSQYLIISDIIKKCLDGTAKLKDHIIATTSANSGNLIKIAKEENLKTFYIPDGVGGRFSELCPVGLLPAAVLGIDINEMLEGAAIMDKASDKSNIYQNAPLMSALLKYLSMKNGKNISVMMPYADSLKYVADWYAQLWGESLGKKFDLKGKVVNCGQTPVKALGVTDQHSQIQLFNEGPDDKVITFIGVKKFRSDCLIPQGLEKYENVNFLCGHYMSELINTERDATAYALMSNNKPSSMIMLDEVNENSFGQLLMFFMLETAYCGAMLNINTFDQPGVEQGKNATYAMFNRPGYENLKVEISKGISRDDEFIIGK